MEGKTINAWRATCRGEYGYLCHSSCRASIEATSITVRRSTIKDLRNNLINNYTMKQVAVGVVLMLVLALITPSMAADEGRYSYITVQDVTIRLEKADAVVSMNYTVDDSVGFLVLLLGKSDLEQKVLNILNFNNVSVQYLGLDHAEVRVDGVANDYGDGTYWFPEHRFGVAVPSLTIITPQSARHYENTSEIPGGFGYFA